MKVIPRSSTAKDCDSGAPDIPGEFAAKSREAPDCREIPIALTDP